MVALSLAPLKSEKRLSESCHFLSQAFFCWCHWMSFAFCGLGLSGHSWCVRSFKHHTDFMFPSPESSSMFFPSALRDCELSFQPHYQKTAHWILCQHLSTSVHSFLPDVNSVLMLAVEERCQILFGLKWKIHRAVQVEISPQAVWGSQKHLIHEKLGEAHWSRVCSVINRLSGAFAAFQSHGKHQTADFKSFPAAGLSGWPVQLRPFPFKVERGSFSLRAGCTSPTHLEREPPVWWHFLQQRSHWSVDGSFTL